ncbi:ShlB/FhaC/HecB family hemolysin secretion/activation protein [Leptolyngbya sp. CCNP1308]|uniref:ShlB/FhaC/HecB family hemolysin secretion/activation protein n=1 Tax=Leptolyngbya sp. CCNP1308 TaxID=3110255 RepID=UPI002B1FEFB0|nr:ShlB/FhaC/HecB family hemolysin secretion/activation protein [Leptolyngbya sp. CCNP1308]MEA5449227.1 ShlB/FhaC/HecB family hemolysin secretion/activation protein [Leptolyngbya sp. CCNP1308]
MGMWKGWLGLTGAIALLPGSAAIAFQPAQTPEIILAQSEVLPSDRPSPRLDELPPSRQPLPELSPGLPSPEDLLQVPPGPEPGPAQGESDRLCIAQFEVVGSTIASPTALADLAGAAVFPAASDCMVDDPTPRPGYQLTFPQLQQARDAVTRYYVDNGYITSGALIPEQRLDAGIVQIQVLEGQVDAIEVQGLTRLNPTYVQNRIALAAQPPLNVERLLQGLQLLQTDPLIATIEVELLEGLRPGTNQLVAYLTEADPYRLQFTLDNSRTPLVGSVQRRVSGGHLNLLGQGDRLVVNYANTSGSNSLNLAYIYPLNARNGTLSLSHGRANSRVIDETFQILNIASQSRYTEITYRQPLYQTPTQELALSFTGSRQSSASQFNPGGFGELPFPSRGANDQGNTRLTALRFSQDWTRRDSRQVLALRSQFSLGLNALGATQNPIPPDGNFFSWRGQGQWVYLLGPDTPFFLRSELQLADRPLLPLEQIGLGGPDSVRGYRQDQRLTDNGFTASSEVHVPIFRAPAIDGLLQVIPFIDLGIGWNAIDTSVDSNTLLSTGLGLSWVMVGGFSARLDYGIPLVSTPSTGSSWQENGLTFSVRYEPY